MKLSHIAVTIISFVKNHRKRALIHKAYKLRNQRGIEIGGPSALFNVKGYFPVYLFAERIDGVNFSNSTVWEGQLQEGQNYLYYNNKKGYQFIAEGSDLSAIRDDQYDFLLSCHSLEHVANPIKAVKDWVRVLKPGGQLILVLPDKEFTFDHKRPYTTFKHLLQDFNKNVTEDDYTHFEEVIQLHDTSKDPGIKNQAELKARVERNFENRCVHHHVFEQSVIKELLEHCGLQVTYQQKGLPFHLITIATKRI